MEYLELIKFIYQQHNPQKLAETESLLNRHVGREEFLLSRICIKYNIDQSTLISKYQEWKNAPCRNSDMDSKQSAEYEAYLYTEQYEAAFGSAKKKSKYSKFIRGFLIVLGILLLWEIWAAVASLIR